MICLPNQKCFQIAISVTKDAIRRTDPQILRQNQNKNQTWHIVDDMISGGKRFDAADWGSRSTWR
jgi:hypothetical protein